MRTKANRYCRICGAVAPDLGRFCASCGAGLNLKTPHPAPGTADASQPLVQLDNSPGVITPSVVGSVRMGFGIALGMVLFLALVLVVVLVAIGLATTTITWPFAQQGQRFQGIGPSDSVPVVLDGTYLVDWAATPTSPSACNLHASLRSQVDPRIEVDLANAGIEGGPTPIAGSRTVTVVGASYVVHVESGCSWSLRLEHR